MADKPERLDPQENTNGNWWEESLNRRQAGKRIAGIGAGAALLVTTGSLIGCGDGDDVSVEETAASARDAIDVQKADGWNVGATDKMLKLRNASPTDSKGSLDGWKQYQDPKALRAAWEPSDAEWKPYVSSELVNALSQPSLKKLCSAGTFQVNG